MTRTPPREDSRDAPAHRLWVASLDLAPGAEQGQGHGHGRVVVEGDEAHHAARVKRLRVGEAVEVFDGRGVVVSGRVAALGGSRAHPVIEIDAVEAAREVAPVSPRVEVCAPVPKGDRAEWMVDQLSQAGAAAWRPLACARGESSVTPKRLGKLRRVAVESAKQCGRAHVIEIGGAIGFEEAIAHGACVMAGVGGSGGVRGAYQGEVRVVIGPEGGWTGDEVRAAAARDVPLIGLGPHVLRIETAAVLAAARVLAGLAPESGDRS